jgi:hypothetical protein
VSTNRQGADVRDTGNSSLPETAGRIIRALARTVASCSQSPPGERAVVATIRGRPVDGQGRRGCHVEFRTAGPPPADGLHAVRRAGSVLARRESWTGGSRCVRGQPIVAMHALGLDELLLGGWRVTMDLRWLSQ